MVNMRFDSTSFGRVVLDGRVFTHDIIVTADGSVLDRPKNMGSHTLSDSEVKSLLQGRPEVIVIGTGQYGSLKVGEDAMNSLRRDGARIVVLPTPAAIREFNAADGRKAALIHVTC